MTTVIVVDDDVFVCRALKTQIEILGYSVFVFNSGEEMLASELHFDGACILADVYLPGMSGIEVDRRLRVAGMSFPTILMSARDDAETTRMMRAAKPIALLFKPFEPSKLERALSKAARRFSRA